LSLPKSWDSQATLSANADRIIFSSDRPGGRGGLDLWYSQRQSDAAWSEPVNLGSEINTEGDEKSPFLHADGRTLFFSSDGHPGMGGFDVFYNDLALNLRPINLGFPINTDQDELSFGVHANEPLGYFSKRSEATGFDMLRFELPSTAAGREVSFVRGTIEGDLPQDGRSTQIRIENLKSKTSQTVIVDASSRTFTAVIAREDLAASVLSLDHPDLGYTAIRLEAQHDQEPVPALIARKATAGEEFALRSILFTSASAQLSAEDQLALLSFAAYLNDHSAFKIEIQGHTDNVGTERTNQILSQQRAQSVMEALIQLGLAPIRLRAKGYGSSKPVGSNQSSEGRSLNRRTAFVILP
jgi:outer membrane protein OmpA-like peptidoglycan-associated protein